MLIQSNNKVIDFYIQHGLYKARAEGSHTIDVEYLMLIDYKLNGKRVTVSRTAHRYFNTDELRRKNTNALKRLIKGETKKLVFCATYDKERPNMALSLLGFVATPDGLIIELLNSGHTLNSTYRLARLTSSEIIIKPLDGGTQEDAETISFMFRDIFSMKQLSDYLYVDKRKEEARKSQSNLYIEEYQRQTGTQIQFGVSCSEQRRVAILEKIYSAYNTTDELVGITKHSPLKKLIFIPKHVKRLGGYYRSQDMIEIPIFTAEKSLEYVTSVFLHEYMHKLQGDLLGLGIDNPYVEYNKDLYRHMMRTVKATGKHGYMGSVHAYAMQRALSVSTRHLDYLMKDQEVVCRAMETFYFTRYLGLSREVIEEEHEFNIVLLTDRELDIVLDMLAKAKFSFE